jgi:hypothetical protein
VKICNEFDNDLMIFISKHKTRTKVDNRIKDIKK